MVNTDQIHRCSIEIMDMYGVLDDVVAKVVGFAVNVPMLDAGTGQPDAKASRVMVATIIFMGQCALRIDGATKLASPNNERIVQQTALFQIDQKGRRGLVGVVALAANFTREIRMLIPATMVELDKSYASFRQPTRQ